jgi:hypothetical protein
VKTIVQILPNGKYAVGIKLKHNGHRKLVTILIKYIKNNRGENHIPGLLSRFFKVPYMSFGITVENGEIVFTYDNGIMVDKLRKVNKIWLGQIYLKGVHAGTFILKPIK